MLQPLRGKILVEVLQDNKRTESGLYLAGIKEEVPHRGKVITIGAPYRDRKGREFPWGFGAGHIVHYKRVWDGLKTSYQVLRRDQIFAIEHLDKAYALGDQIIVKKLNNESYRGIIIPSHLDTFKPEQIEYVTVTSIGRDNKMGINVGDKLMTFKNEGLKVNIPLQEDLWSLKPRAILAKIQENNASTIS